MLFRSHAQLPYTMTGNLIPHEALRGFIEAAFVQAGLPPADAASVASLMAEADLQGSDGHGVIRLPQYLKRLNAGGINKHPDIRIVQERAAMAVVDGDNGMGHLVVSRAVDIAIEKARSAGVAWVGTRYSNHAGPAGVSLQPIMYTSGGTPPGIPFTSRL